MMLNLTALCADSIDQPHINRNAGCQIALKNRSQDNANSITIPFHWNDVNKFKDDYTTIQKLYLRVLPETADSLNRFHDKEWSLRQWEIVIGPWLRAFISIVFERHETIKTVLKEQPISSVAYANFESFRAPLDSLDFFEVTRNDAWNQTLMLDIIKSEPESEKIALIEFNDCISSINTPKNNQHSRLYRLASTGSLRNITKRFIGSVLSIISRKNKFVLYGLDIQNKELFKLYSKIRQLPVHFLPEINFKKLDSRSIRRDKFNLSMSESHSVRLLSILIKEYMPKSFIENFSDIHNFVSLRYPKAPEIILTSVSYYINDFFKIWTSEMVGKGAKYYIHQHGGNYGVSAINDSEELQLRTSDKFYTWGWSSSDIDVSGESATKKEETSTTIIPMPSLKLSIIKNEYPTGVYNITSENIILPLSEWPRFSYRLYSAPMADQQLEYIDEAVLFSNNLKPQLKKMLRFRIQPNERGWNLKGRLQEKGLSDALGKQGPTFIDDLKGARISVINTNSTTVLESLILNIPTVLLLRPKWWKLSDIAKPYYENLKEVGILHETAHSAAEWVNNNYSDPLKWWLRDETQLVVERFLDQFGRTEKDWKKTWADCLVK